MSTRESLPAPLGRYIPERRIGMGGMAEVFRARINTDGFRKAVCIKRLLPHVVESEEMLSMFRTEAALAARLDHANIVKVFDFGDVDGDFFLAMELVEGVDLAVVGETQACGWPAVQRSGDIRRGGRRGARAVASPPRHDASRRAARDRAP